MQWRPELTQPARGKQYYDEDDQHGLAAKANRKHIKDFARLRANCGFIEISRDGKLERVFFQIPSVCRYLSKASKRNIVRKVNRDNHQAAAPPPS